MIFLSGPIKRELEKQNNLHMSDRYYSFYEDQKDQHKHKCLEIIESPDLRDFFLASSTNAGKKTQWQVQVIFQHQILAQVHNNIIHPSHQKLNLYNQTTQTSIKI